MALQQNVEVTKKIWLTFCGNYFRAILFTKV